MGTGTGMKKSAVNRSSVPGGGGDGVRGRFFQTTAAAPPPKPATAEKKERPQQQQQQQPLSPQRLHRTQPRETARLSLTVSSLQGAGAGAGAGGVGGGGAAAGAAAAASVPVVVPAAPHAAALSSFDGLRNMAVQQAAEDCITTAAARQRQKQAREGASTSAHSFVYL